MVIVITKSGSIGVEIDWNAVNRATEKACTYLIINKEGREFFKMYKPSEFESISKKKGWTGYRVTHLEQHSGRYKYGSIVER